MTVDSNLEWQWLSALKPPLKLPAADWAEANIVLPDSFPEPGPLRLTAYQRGLVAAIDDPATEIIVLELASQTGKSLTIDAALLSLIAQEPGPILVVHPSEGKARDYMRSRLDPLIDSCCAVKNVIGANARTSGGSSLTYKDFAGGNLAVASSYNPDDLAARAIRYLLLDEIDRYARSAGSEGDPVELAINRTRNFRNRKIIIASTPTAKATSRIEEWFRRGTQERFFCPCPECGTFDYYRIDQLKWTKGNFSTAHLLCEHCGHHTTEAERLRAVERGVWTPTAETSEKGVRSFHASELLSKFSNLADVAKRSEEAERTIEKKKAFVNTTLAEVYDFDDAIALDANDLQQRSEAIGYPLPKDVNMITLGGDVQADRVELSYIAHTVDDRAIVFRHEKHFGDTAGSEVWKLLDEVFDAAFDAAFKTQDGRILPTSGAAIDAGFNTTYVAQFVAAQRKKQRNVVAIKGVGGFDKPVIKKGTMLKGLTQLYLVGVDGMKANIQRRLNMQEVGPGFIHLADTLEPAYFEGLCVEQLRTRFVRGYAKQEFHNSARGGNEPLDCLAYGLAVATIAKIAKPKNAQPKPQGRAPNLNALVNANSERTSYYG